MLMSAQTGPGIPNNPDGSGGVGGNPLRLGHQNDLIVSELNGRYYEQTYRNLGYHMDSDAVTLAAANATKGAAGTIKLINGFVNPYGSGVNAVINFVRVATVSGTPAGPYFFNHQNFPNGVTVSSAATGTIASNLLGHGVGSGMTAQTGVVITRSDSATTAFVQTGVLGGPAAIAAGAGMYDVSEEVAGRIIVPPGVIFGIACVGAGTSHVVQSTIWWSEVPI
jgi:hypothetical protein